MLSTSWEMLGISQHELCPSVYRKHLYVLVTEGGHQADERLLLAARSADFILGFI